MVRTVRARAGWELRNGETKVGMLFFRCLADQKDRQGLYCRADCLSFHDSDSIGRGNLDSPGRRNHEEVTSVSSV